MKALVISDRPEIIEYVTPLLKEKGFDLIHYRWIIKALDNIEEIQPDVIVLSAGEYPRHWKTLAGFVQSGIGGNDVKVYLYETTPLSDEDSKKTKELGVYSFTEAFAKCEETEPEEKLVEEFNDEEEVDAAYNDPFGALKLCKGRFYKSENLVELDINLTNGSYLNYLSLFDGNSVTSYSAVVEEAGDGVSSLRVKEL